jgi:putative transposase
MQTTEKPGWRDRGYIPHFDANCLLQHIVLSGIVGVDLTAEGLAQIIEGAILHYDKQRYCLHAWCIMPDHLHIYVAFSPNQLMGRNVLEWKPWITRSWQKISGDGSRVFSVDYFDRYSRTLDQPSRAIGYIESNPVVAGYVAEPAEWRWSSAWHKARGWEPAKDWLPVFLPSGSR